MKKLLFYIFFIPFFLVIEVINWLSILLDELFFTSYKKTIIKSPLYISGMPRSGTTFMHNLINLDSNKFTSMKLWEIAFAPSILQKKICISIIKFDKRLNRPLKKLVSCIEKVIFKKFNDFHPLKLSIIEEDEYILIHNFSSSLLAFFFPVFKSFFLSGAFNPGTSNKLKFYKNCIAKHIFVFGKDKTYLAKSPSHLLRYSLLKDTFPDLKMICMIRMPHQTVPSTITLFKNFSTIFHSQLKIELIIEKTLGMADQSFQKLTEERDNNNPSFLVVKFEELIKKPGIVISELFGKFGYIINDDYKNKLESHSKKYSEYISNQKYTLEEYNLSKNSIINRYKYIYKYYYSHKILFD